MVKKQNSNLQIGTLVFVRVISTFTDLVNTLNKFNSYPYLPARPNYWSTSAPKAPWVPISTTTTTVTSTTSPPQTLTWRRSTPPSQPQELNQGKTYTGNSLKMSTMKNVPGPGSQATGWASANHININTVGVGPATGNFHNFPALAQCAATGYKTIEEYFLGNKSTVEQKSDKNDKQEKSSLDEMAFFTGKPFHGIVVDRYSTSEKTERGEVVDLGNSSLRLYKVLFGERHCLWFTQEELTIMKKEKEGK